MIAPNSLSERADGGGYACFAAGDAGAISVGGYAQVGDRTVISNTPADEEHGHGASTVEIGDFAVIGACLSALACVPSQSTFIPACRVPPVSCRRELRAELVLA